jgi:S1-C subfamily serine protease
LLVSRIIKVVLAIALVLSVVALVSTTAERSQRMARQVEQLTAEVQRLTAEGTMPSAILTRHTGSICYIYASFSRGTRRSEMQLSGTGFVVADGWIATNRHVVEPSYNDGIPRRLHAQEHRERLVAFFPGNSHPLDLTDVHVARDADIAVAHFEPALLHTRPVAVPLTTNTPRPGDWVLVVGYPLGVEGMRAKSPERTYRRLAYEVDDLLAAEDLAQHRLIRPSATQGHVGDVVGDTVVYDAATAPGGSGGPVFNSRGEVVAVNSAYMSGFAGGTLGISVTPLRELLSRTVPQN